MSRLFRIAGTVTSLALVMALTGCAYFDTHDGYEEGDAPRWGVQGMATYELVGVSPTSASAGDTVDLYLVSEEDAPVRAFDVGDFWFCTFDGESAMLETGGDSYEPNVDADEAIAVLDGIELEELEGSVISTISFTVPEGTVAGEGFVITPNNSTEYFYLGID
jgi:hypothetical protein